MQINEMLNILTAYSLCGRDTQCHIVGLLVEVMRLKDDLLYQHSIQVADISHEIAKAIDFNDPDLIVVSGLLHDLGKIKVPDAILNKQGQLTNREYEVIQMHPVVGCEVLIKYNMHDVANIILHHHERPDGTGYPHGKTNGTIPVGSKIIAVADMFAALTSYRPYKPSYPSSRAVEISLSQLAGFFPPDVTEKVKTALITWYNKHIEQSHSVNIL